MQQPPLETNANAANDVAVRRGIGASLIKSSAMSGEGGVVEIMANLDAADGGKSNIYGAERISDRRKNGADEDKSAPIDLNVATTEERAASVKAVVTSLAGKAILHCGTLCQ